MNAANRSKVEHGKGGPQPTCQGRSISAAQHDISHAHRRVSGFHCRALRFAVVATRSGSVGRAAAGGESRPRARRAPRSQVGADQSALNQLAAHSDRVGGPRAPRDVWTPVLEATLSGLSGIGSLNVIDEDGVVALSTNPAVTATSRRDRFLYRRLKADPSIGLVIAPSAPSPNYTGLVIPFGRALRDRQGRFIGLLAATFQAERLRGFYEAIDVGPHGIIQLLHPDGYVLFRQPLAGHSAGEPRPTMSS